MNNDGYESAILGGRPMPVASVITNRMCYDQGGLYSRIVDLPADKCVSQGVEVEGAPEELDSELDRLKVLPALADAIRWSRLDGGGAIIIVGDDGLIHEPLDIERLTRIEELRAVSTHNLSPDTPRYSDPLETNYNTPVWYWVNNGAARFRVHESRIVRVPGDPLAIPRTSIPWEGRSAVEAPYQAIRLYKEGLRAAKNILNRKQQPVYKMKGLADMIMQGLESRVQARIGLVDQARGILNTVAVDSEDEYTISDLQVAGVRDILNEFQISVSVESGIPVTILFGRSPAGMNSTGDADFKGYHEMVEGIRKNKATPALEKLVAVIFAQTSLPAPPENWFIKWPSLSTPTDQEAAATRKTNAEAQQIEMNGLNIALGTGALSELQALEWMKQQGYFGLDEDETGSRSYANDA